MGIKLTDIVVKRQLWENELRGKVVAFDTYNMLYQFISSIRTSEGYPLSNSDGVVISHLKGILSRTSNLMNIGVRPIMVFDGKPHELKKGTLDQRRERKEKAIKDWERAIEVGDLATARTKAMQTSHLTEEMVEQTVTLLRYLGIPTVMAPSDGEGQASYMCKKGDAYAVSSQDFDSLLFGCPLLVRNLGVTGRRKQPGKNSYITVLPEVISLEDSLINMGVSRKQLVDMAVMIGTDFNEGVNGIGPKKALKLIKELGDLETVTKVKRFPLLEYQEVRKIFLEPSVTDDYSIDLKKPDEDKVLGMLVGDLGFGEEGVRKNLDLIARSDNGEVENEQSSLDIFL